jgi:hypothetical protein
MEMEEVLKLYTWERSAGTEWIRDMMTPNRVKCGEEKNSASARNHMLIVQPLASQFTD